MPLITIQEKGKWGDSPNAVVSFDRRGEYPVTITDPFKPEETKRVEWYFEKYLMFPFTEQVKAQQAAESLKTYGEKLFAQVFAGQIQARYFLAKQAGLNTLRFEIIGSPEFHTLHWESLKDPELAEPFVVHAPMVRSTFDPPTITMNVQTAPTINLLVVSARPGGQRDVGYRTISRPLVEGLRKANVPVNIEILRPGTYKALVEHLDAVRDRHGVGYYHIIHFDLHGALLRYAELDQGCQDNFYTYQRYARAEIPQYKGQKAFLFFEEEQAGKSDPAEAGEVANLILSHHIPIVILNACQSGKQTGENETHLGNRLLQAGVQTVLAMGYSVTVSAAQLLMTTLYVKLFQQNDLPVAIRHARAALYNDKERRVYFNQTIKLEDWLLPVVYQSGAGMQSLPLRQFTFAEQAAYYAALADRYRAPQPEYGFVGRDMDVLQIEKRLLSQSDGKRRNLLLIHGMGGAGKTTLLHHLAEWWQTTHFVGHVFYFGYDEKAWTLQQIMDNIAGQLFGNTPYPPQGGILYIPPQGGTPPLRGSGGCSPPGN